MEEEGCSAWRHLHTPKDGVKILRAVGEHCDGKADAQGKLLVIKSAESHSFKPKIEHGP